MHAFWAESEELLRDLLDDCLPFLNASQRDMAKELIDHNEHQLALEFLFDYLDEQSRNYPPELIEKFRALDGRLHLTGNRDPGRLGHV